MTDESHQQGKHSGTSRHRQSTLRIISQGKDVTQERQKQMRDHRKVVQMAKKKIAELDSE